MAGIRTVGLFVGVTAAVAAAAAVAACMRHGRPSGPSAPGGMLVRNVGGYDRMSRVLLGSLFDGIAEDMSRIVPAGGRVLEVGCGPGQLSIRLARRPGPEVTGLDLDPAMVDRARANADRSRSGERPPTFVVGDVAALPFPDGAFDVVVSTFSMHHWTDPAAGIAEIARVLRPAGRAVVWDFRPGARFHPFGPRHAHLPDPAEHARGTGLRVESAIPWRWPWRFSLAQRVELVHEDGSSTHAG